MQKFRVSLRVVALAASLFLPLSALDATITVDHSLTYQTIRGLGSSTRTADPAMRTDAFQNHYLDVFGASAFRTWLPYDIIGTTANPADIKYENFNETAVEASLRIAIDLKTKKPDLYLIGTFWTPPGWMKVSGQSNGTDGRNSSVNVLREDREDHFAKFVVEVAKMLRDKYSTPLDALCIQNELRFDTFYGSCVYTPEQYTRVFKKVVQAFQAEDYEMKFFGPEHMTADVLNNKIYIDPIMADPEIAPYMAYFAAHGYTNGVEGDNDPASATRFWDGLSFPYNREYWMTETSGESHDWSGALDNLGGKVMNSLVGGRASLFTYWLANHESPLHVEELFDNGIPQKKSYVFQHFSKYIRPGMVRVSATPATNQQLDIATFVDFETDQMVFVIMNRSDNPRSETITLAQDHAFGTFQAYQTTASTNFAQLTDITPQSADTLALTLPARSITTLVGTVAGIEPFTYTVSPTSITVPSAATEIEITVTTSGPTAGWTAKRRSTAGWCSVSSPEESTGTGPAIIKVQQNRFTTDRFATFQIAGVEIAITQLAPGLPTIYTEPTTADLGNGIKYNALGFLYDTYYPFVYSWHVGDWLYIHHEGASETHGYFLFNFAAEAWGWTNSTLYPYYYRFTEEGTVAELLGPTE